MRSNESGVTLIPSNLFTDSDRRIYDVIRLGMYPETEDADPLYRYDKKYDFGVNATHTGAQSRQTNSTRTPTIKHLGNFCQIESVCFYIFFENRLTEK